MGHTRLGTIPKSRKWIEVVQTLSDIDADQEQVAAASESVDFLAGRTLSAAQEYLKSATSDLGLRFTFYLLARVALASRQSDFIGQLSDLGIRLGPDDTLIDLTSEFQGAVDTYLRAHRHSSDISELAQQAAGESLTFLVGPRSSTLFGSGATELQQAVRALSTKKGFSVLGQKFFGTFMARFINFYLSRVTAAQLGTSSLPQVDEISRFNRALQLHCEQSARIVRDFSGQWLSKTEYQEGINLANTSGFLAVALRKLQAELGVQEAEI